MLRLSPRVQKNIVSLAGAGAILFSVYCRLSEPEVTWFNTHMARDFERGMEWFRLRPSSWLGPEMNSGVRLYGPAFYWVIALFWAFTRSIPGVLLGIHALTLAVSLVFCRAVTRELGKFYGTLFFLLFILMPVHVQVSRTLWNPSLIVPITLLILMTVRKFCLFPHQTRWLVFFFLLGWVGLQVHHSLLAAIVSGLVLIVFATRRYKQVGWGIAALGGYLLYIVVFQLPAQPADVVGATRVLSIGERIHGYLVNVPGYLGKWGFHVFLNPRPLHHYELFPLTFKFGRIFDPETTQWFLVFTKALGSLVLGLFVVSLLLLVAAMFQKARKRGEIAFFEKAVLVWTVVVVGSLSFYSRGTVIPYRYGLMWYPLQFLVIPLALKNLPTLFPRWSQGGTAFYVRSGVAVVCLITFLGNGSFLLWSYRVMSSAGRASHVAYDTFETDLGHKLELTRWMNPTERSPHSYSRLHGLIANKVLAMEVDMTQADYYGALLTSEGLPKKSLVESDHYWVESLSLAEMTAHYRAKDSRAPFHLRKLDPEDVPLSVLATFRSPSSKLGHTLFTRDQALFPLLNAPAGDLSTITLEFSIPTSGKRYLRMGFDETAGSKVLSLVALTVDGSPQSVRFNTPDWLAQKEIIFPLATDRSSAKIFAEFRVHKRNARFSRVDIFKTETGLVPYEGEEGASSLVRPIKTQIPAP